MIESPAGAVNAALIPLTKRVAISSEPSLANPPSIEATTNTPSETRNIRRRQKRAAARPARGRKPPERRTDALTPHSGERVEIYSSEWVEGMGALVFEMAIASVK